MSSESVDIFALPRTRRIVTGHDEDSKSKVLYDDTEGYVRSANGLHRFQLLWLTDSVPADNSTTNGDPTKSADFEVVNDGSVCEMVWIRPGAASPMHRTKSIDYGVMLEGQVELELDNGERRLLKAGDVIVQRGTKHAWYNTHPTQWAKLMFVGIASSGTGPRYSEA